MIIAGGDSHFSQFEKKCKKAKLCPKIGTIKDRNGMDLTEAEDTKKRLQEYTDELYRKELMTQK